MITTSSGSSTPRKVTPTEIPNMSGKSNTAGVTKSINADQPSGEFSLGIPPKKTKANKRNHDIVLSLKTMSIDASEIRHDDAALEREQRNFSEEASEGDLESSDSPSPAKTLQSITLRTARPGETIEYGIPDEDSKNVESITTESDDDSVDDPDSNVNENAIPIQDGVGGADADAALATQKECVRKKYLLYAGGCFAGILMMSVTTVFLVRAFGRKDQPNPQVSPDFESSAFDAFKRCARALGLDLTVDDKALVANLVGNLRDAYGRELATVSDVGALLECRSTESDGLGGIYLDFADQMRAIINAAAAAAGLSSPSACLVVLSLLYLFTNGMM